MVGLRDLNTVGFLVGERDGPTEGHVEGLTDGLSDSKITQKLIFAGRGLLFHKTNCRG